MGISFLVGELLIENSTDVQASSAVPLSFRLSGLCGGDGGGDSTMIFRRIHSISFRWE